MERQEQIEQEEPYTKIPMPEPYLENMYKSLTEYPKKRLVDIDKVCEWLEEHLYDYWSQKITDPTEFINELKNELWNSTLTRPK